LRANFVVKISLRTCTDIAVSNTLFAPVQAGCQVKMAGRENRFGVEKNLSIQKSRRELDSRKREVTHPPAHIKINVGQTAMQMLSALTA
jgi:hypothetical protein